MSHVNIALPKLGESIQRATVVQWLKKEGDMIRLDDPLLEVSTDKINSEIPSPVAGRLVRIAAGVDHEVEVGALLAVIEAGGPAPVVAPAAVLVSSACPQKTAPVLVQPSVSLQPSIPKPADDRFWSPAVLRLAKERGISQSTLETLVGTGLNGRVTRRDVADFAASAPASDGDIVWQKLSPRRKAIADGMRLSVQTAAHASLVNDFDVTDLVQAIASQKEAFETANGVKLTLTAYFMRALVKAAQAYPLCNATIKDNQVGLHKHVNIGVAVSVGQDLLVPVVKGAEQLSLMGLAKAISQLAKKARSNQLSLDDVQGGTITLSNFGMSNVLIGIPIIKQPESAIVAMGAVRKTVVVDDTGAMRIRDIMHVSMSFDHRIIDGMMAASFLNTLKDSLSAQG